MRMGVLDDLSGIEGVKWAGLVSYEGFMHEVSGIPGASLEGSASLAPNLLTAVKNMAENWSLDDVVQSTLVGEDGTVIITQLDDSTALMCQTLAGANLGLIRAAISDSVDRLKPFLD